MANGGTQTNPFSDWWSEFGSSVLEQYEPMQYYSSPTGMAFAQGSPSRQRFFSNAYQDIFQDYLGQSGTRIRGGEAPDTFMDYMETNNPWTARYSRLPQTARGVTGIAANTKTRFLYNF